MKKEERREDRKQKDVLLTVAIVSKQLNAAELIFHHFNLKAQQQRHERDLALLKLKAEQEALECQRQLEETRNKTAQVIYFVAGIDSLNLKFYI